MKLLDPNRLPAVLAKRLAPVYLICGEEPLQIEESCDAVRTMARQRGYGEREVLIVDASFDWSVLHQAADTLSVFASQKLVELRLPDKLDAAHLEPLRKYCERPAGNTLLLAIAGKLPSQAQKLTWFQAVENIGVIVESKILQGAALHNWLRQRLAQRGLTTDGAGLLVLAERVEGHLLAAAQEIEKLYILHGEGHLSAETIRDAVADSARYDVFNLSDALLLGETARVTKMLNGLHAEGTAALVVLWAIARELRTLWALKQWTRQLGSFDSACQQLKIWPSRKRLVAAADKRLSMARIEHALRWCVLADQQAKGARLGDPWHSLYQACLLTAHRIEPTSEFFHTAVP